MKNWQGKYFALFFAACFLALQFHPVGETQLEHNAKRTFHIEQVSTSVIENSIDNRFIYVQLFQSKQVHLSQQKATLKQHRQFIGVIKRQVEHAFRPFMHPCLAAICQDYQDKLLTSFNYLQKLKLSFEFNPFLTTNIMQVHTDESDSLLSLI